MKPAYEFNMLKLHSHALAVDFPAGVTKLDVYSRRLKHGPPHINSRFCDLIYASNGNLTPQNSSVYKHTCCSSPSQAQTTHGWLSASFSPNHSTNRHISSPESSLSKTKTSMIGKTKGFCVDETLYCGFGGRNKCQTCSHMQPFSHLPHSCCAGQRCKRDEEEQGE